MMFATFFESGVRETAFSLLSAASSWTADKKLQQTIAASFRRCSPLIYTLPCRVNKFCEITMDHYGTPEMILNRHSLFEFFCAGLPAGMRENLSAQLINGKRFRTSAPKLPIFIEAGNRYGLECPECSIEVRKKIGRRVSTCDVCIPFSTRCAIHGCDFVTFDSASRVELAFIKPTCSTEKSILYSATARLVANDGLSRDYRKLIMSELKEKGYVLESGRIRLRELREDMAKIFSEGFEDQRLNYLCRASSFCDNVTNKIHRSDRAIHPALLTLMIMLLSSSQGRSTKTHTTVSNAMAQDDRVVNTLQVEENRARWIEHRALHPNLSRTSMRMVMQALWTWLYRHDREWLSANQEIRLSASYRKYRKKSNLPTFVRLIFTTGNAQHAGESALPLIGSAYKQRRYYGLTDYALARIAEETGAIGKFAALPGERDICLARRVSWAITTLLSDNCMLDEWLIARRASIRVTSLNKTTIIMNSYQTLEK